MKYVRKFWRSMLTVGVLTLLLAAMAITASAEDFTVSRGDTLYLSHPDSPPAGCIGYSYDWYITEGSSLCFISNTTSRNATIRVSGSARGTTISGRCTLQGTKNGSYSQVTGGVGFYPRPEHFVYDYYFTIHIKDEQPPEIRIQPADDAAGIGEDATASVLIWDASHVYYTWYVRYPGSTDFVADYDHCSSSGRTITYKREMYPGFSGMEVYCVLEDEHGYSTTSETATLSWLGVQEPPALTTVDFGETASVSVDAAGRHLEYQWYIRNLGDSDFVKSSNTTPTYSMKITKSQPGRAVYCVITNDIGYRYQTQTVTLRNRYYATITDQPDSVTGMFGDTLTVSTEATGDGLTYQWWVKNPKDSRYTKTSITTPSYNVKLDAANSGTKLQCVVKDAYGRSVKTDVVTVSIRERRHATITQQPESAIGNLGDTLKISVEATGDGVTYQWWAKSPKDGCYTKTPITTPCYTVKLDAANSGTKFQCVVKDAYGHSVKTDVVTIAGQYATITQQPKSVIGKPGDTLTVSVGATGDGLTYQWYIKNPQDSRYSKSSTTTADYTIKLTEANSGRCLRCVVTDAYGRSVKSDVAVMSQLYISRQPKGMAAAAGQTCSATVSAVGEGLKYQWYIKDPDQSKYYKSSTTSATYAISMNADRDGRKVCCIITDKYGNSIKTNAVTLSMINITKQPASNSALKGEAAEVSVEAEGAGLTYEWYIKYPGESGYRRTITDSSSYSLQMGQMNHGTLVRCLITDKYGNSVRTDAAGLYVLVLTGFDSQATGNIGETVYAKVSAVGKGLQYQWYYMDPGSSRYSKSSTTSATYAVPMTMDRTGRCVRCVITDEFGNKITTDVVQFSWLAITVQPEDVSAEYYDPVQFSVTAVGEGLSYQWYSYEYVGQYYDEKECIGYSTEIGFKITYTWARKDIYCVITDKYGNTVTTRVVHASVE